MVLLFFLFDKKDFQIEERMKSLNLGKADYRAYTFTYTSGSNS